MRGWSREREEGCVRVCVRMIINRTSQRVYSKSLSEKEHLFTIYVQKNRNEKQHTLIRRLISLSVSSYFMSLEEEA